MLIRTETTTDAEAIGALIYAAFKDHPHHEPGAEPTEHCIVHRLRQSGGLTLSLVAEQDGQLVGHLALSPITLDGKAGGWFGLGPVAVAPAMQNRGIGSELINTAVKRLQEQGAEGIVVLGDPGYYGRFGFRHLQAIELAGVPSHYFMALPLVDRQAQGRVAYHPAFG